MAPIDHQSILELFERHRAVPGAPFNESHFLDYLVAEPKAMGVVRNSFFGLRYYNAFIDEAQIKFNVCLSNKDFDTNYSLTKFLSRIAELQHSPQGSIASLRNQRRRGFGWGTVVVGNFLAVCLFVAMWRISPPGGYVVAFAVAIVNLVVLRFFRRWRLYTQRLMAQLVNGGAVDT